MVEEWRTAIYNGEVFENYEVSNMGRVRSLNYRGHGKIQILKPYKDSRGYLRIDLFKNRKKQICKLHRLVAFVFIPNNDETKMEINHKDENKENNSVENLEWCDRDYNNSYGTINERRGKSKSRKNIQLAMRL